MRKIEYFINIIHYNIYLYDYKLHRKFSKINPFMLIHKLPFQKRKYKKENIDIFKDLDNTFKDPTYGFSSVRAGGIMYLLSLLFAFSLFMYSVGIMKRNIEGFFIFIIAFPFAILIYYTVLYNDKYLLYFKKFDQESSRWKRKWSFITIGFIIFIILFLIGSFNFSTYMLNK